MPPRAIELHCIVCGEQCPRNSSGNRRLTCSDACFREARRLQALDMLYDREYERWTPEEALDALRSVARQLGRAPTKSEWHRLASGSGRGAALIAGKERATLPSVPVFREHFGSWNNAIEQTRFKPRPQGYTSEFDGRKVWTKKKIVAALREWARLRKRTPTATDWLKPIRKNERVARPALLTVVRYFGTWTAALEAAKLKPVGAGNGQRKNPKLCRKGKHPWIAANLYTAPGQNPTCRLCINERNRRRRRRLKTARR